MNGKDHYFAGHSEHWKMILKCKVIWNVPIQRKITPLKKKKNVKDGQHLSWKKCTHLKINLNESIHSSH